MSNIRVIDSAENYNMKIEVLQYEKLAGNSPYSAADLFYAEKMNIKLKQIKITLKNPSASIVTEAGALHYMKGNIELKTGINPGQSVGGFLKNLATSVVTNESAVKPHYVGQGEIYLEPTFGHYALLTMENTTLIADKGIFFCCEPALQIGVETMKNLSTAVAGGEGLFQTKISGSGICVLSIPVPMEELVQVDLNNEVLKVDGNFGLFRMGKIDFGVERSTKSIIGSAATGEGLLQTYRGTGRVWLAPTASVYQNRIGGHR